MSKRPCKICGSPVDSKVGSGFCSLSCLRTCVDISRRFMGLPLGTPPRGGYHLDPIRPFELGPEEEETPYRKRKLEPILPGELG